jgi:uncharacterized protein (DUF2141 family)
MRSGVAVVGAALTITSLWMPHAADRAKAIDLVSANPSRDDLRPPTSVVVRVAGARNEKGILRVALFAAPEGFPERSERAVWTKSVEVQVPVTEVRFERVEAGPWALTVLHDENGNERLDRNLFRIPKEGVGASNDAARSGPHRFERALFVVPPEGITVVVPLHYWM